MSASLGSSSSTVLAEHSTRDFWIALYDWEPPYGRAESLRLCLHLGGMGQALTDIRVAPQNWDDYSALSAYGRCPFARVSVRRSVTETNEASGPRQGNIAEDHGLKTQGTVEATLHSEMISLLLFAGSLCHMVPRTSIEFSATLSILEVCQAIEKMILAAAPRIKYVPRRDIFDKAAASAGWSFFSQLSALDENRDNASLRLNGEATSTRGMASRVDRKPSGQQAPSDASTFDKPPVPPREVLEQSEGQTRERESAEPLAPSRLSSSTGSSEVDTAWTAAIEQAMDRLETYIRQFADVTAGASIRSFGSVSVADCGVAAVVRAIAMRGLSRIYFPAWEMKWPLLAKIADAVSSHPNVQSYIEMEAKRLEALVFDPRRRSNSSLTEWNTPARPSPPPCTELPKLLGPIHTGVTDVVRLIFHKLRVPFVDCRLAPQDLRSELERLHVPISVGRGQPILYTCGDWCIGARPIIDYLLAQAFRADLHGELGLVTTKYPSGPTGSSPAPSASASGLNGSTAQFHRTSTTGTGLTQHSGSVSPQQRRQSQSLSPFSPGNNRRWGPPTNEDLMEADMVFSVTCNLFQEYEQMANLLSKGDWNSVEKYKSQIEYSATTLSLKSLELIVTQSNRVAHSWAALAINVAWILVCNQLHMGGEILLAHEYPRLAKLHEKFRDDPTIDDALKEKLDADVFVL